MCKGGVITFLAEKGYVEGTWEGGREGGKDVVSYPIVDSTNHYSTKVRCYVNGYVRSSSR